MKAWFLASAALGLAGCTTDPFHTSSGPASALTPAPLVAPLEDAYAVNPSDNVKLHYVASGARSLPLVVMIHGYPDYSESWAGLARSINLSYRTAAIDTRGYNLSDKPKGVENYAMPKLVEDLAAVIRAEGRVKATIIGHDWGAAQAWAFAFAHPEMVDKLVILSVPHPATFARELATNPQQAQNSQYARNFQKEGSENSLTAEGLASWVKDPDENAKYVEAFKRSDFAAMMNYYRANYPSGANAPRPDAPPRTYPPINAPVLVIHGMKDQALLASGHAGVWNYVAKDTTLVMIPDAGHFVQHDAAKLVNVAIRNWLNAHP